MYKGRKPWDIRATSNIYGDLEATLESVEGLLTLLIKDKDLDSSTRKLIDSVLEDYSNTLDTLFETLSSLDSLYDEGD